MQSWGISSAFELRGTEHEPSKSGIIGLICAALGRDRNEPIEDLAALKMGVRIDHQGQLEFDFQTAQDVAKASGGVDNQLSKRYYLSDGAFLVGLEGDEALLKRINQRLKNPVWSIFLGRKSYLPSCPIAFSDKELKTNPLDKSLETALREAAPLIAPTALGGQKKVLRILLECPPQDLGAMPRPDQPVSFAYDRRRFSTRYVKNVFTGMTNKES
jgi:CRISPR system Cascade subunit CasD